MKKNFWVVLFMLSIISCRPAEEIVNSGTTTKSELKIETLPATAINQIKADVSGKLLTTNDETILTYGFLINVVEKVDLSNNVGRQSFDFTFNSVLKSTFYGLDGNKKYYSVFYVKTDKNIYYGNVVNFTTPADKEYVGDIALTTQEAVNAFGENRYTKILGDLIISGNVTDLSPLKDLQKVWNLKIRYTQLKNLKGLEGLYYLPRFGDINIIENSKLESLEGLNNLFSVGGHFFFLNNPKLQNLKGLENLETVGRRLTLEVPYLEGLNQNLRTGSFISKGLLEQNLGTRKITCEDYDFNITDAPNLNSLRGFTLGNLQNTLTFTLENLPALTTLEGIVLPDKYHYFYLTDLPNLTSLKGMESFKSLDYLIINGSPKIENMNGLNNLTKIGELNLKNITSLINFAGLEKLTDVENIKIDNCGITTFTGLSNIRDVKYNFNIANCHNFSNFKELSNINYFGHNALGGLGINNCSGISDLAGLGGAQYIGRFTIEGNTDLRSLKGLSSPTIEYLTIGNCNQLTTLYGLENVKNIKFNLHVYNNIVLEDFCPLKKILINSPTISYDVLNNFKNPTRAEILTGCL